MAGSLGMVTPLIISTIKPFLVKKEAAAFQLATGLPSLWEDGADNRLIARARPIGDAKDAADRYRNAGIGCKKQGLGNDPKPCFFVARQELRRPIFRLPPNPA